MSCLAHSTNACEWLMDVLDLGVLVCGWVKCQAPIRNNLPKISFLWIKFADDTSGKSNWIKVIRMGEPIHAYYYYLLLLLLWVVFFSFHILIEFSNVTVFESNGVAANFRRIKSCQWHLRTKRHRQMSSRELYIESSSWISSRLVDFKFPRAFSFQAIH